MSPANTFLLLRGGIVVLLVAAVASGVMLKEPSVTRAAEFSQVKRSVPHAEIVARGYDL